MTLIEKRGAVISAIGTTSLMILSVLLSLIIKIKPVHPEYTEIKITLADVKQVDTEKFIEQPVVQEQPVAQEQPVVQEKQPPQKAQQQVQPAKPAVKKAPNASKPAAPSKQEQVQLQKSVDDLMAENNAPAKKTATWDDSLFDDNDSYNVSKSPSSNTMTPSTKSASSFEGTAAAGSTTANASATSRSSSSSKQSSETASSSTTNALGKIKTSGFTDNSAGNYSSTTTIASENRNGKIAIQMSDGSTRELLSPSNPTISISKKNAELIDSTRQVRISFKVLAGGTVPLNSIEINNAALLPLEIQNEIKAQIHSWIFATSSVDGQATFDYTIIKK